MINIDELTIGQIKELQSLVGCASKDTTDDPLIGEYVIVRTYAAGVFAGTYKKRLGKKILLENCRRLWRWHTANNGVSLSEVAVYGINQANSKICCVESKKIIEDIEISPCTKEARISIEGAKEHVA